MHIFQVDYERSYEQRADGFEWISSFWKLRNDAFQENQGIRTSDLPSLSSFFVFSFYVLRMATVIDCPVSGRQERALYNKSNKAVPFREKDAMLFGEAELFIRSLVSFVSSYITHRVFDHFYKSPSLLPTARKYSSLRLTILIHVPFKN